MVQSGQVAQRATSAQGLNQSEEKSSSTGIQNKKEPDLDPEILPTIGERVHPDRKLAPAIHTKFATGIEEVIKKGLPADKRKGLLEKFPLLKNYLMMDPPKLNPELKTCLQKTITKKDGRIVEKQARITTSLADLLDVLVRITSLRSEEKLPTRELTESLWGVLQDNLPSSKKELLEYKMHIDDTFKMFSKVHSYFETVWPADCLDHEYFSNDWYLDAQRIYTSITREIARLRTSESFSTARVQQQLMADLQHVKSNIRRSLIVKNINASMKETLNATTVDEWLFGEKLEEKVKAAKTLENSSKSLKLNTQQNQTSKSKNSKRPLRHKSSNNTVLSNKNENT